jgi:hypothetical protein
MAKVEGSPPGPGEDELQGLFDRAYEDGIEPPEFDGLWKRLVVVLALPVPQSTGAASGSSSWLSAAGVKGALALLVGGVVAAGVVAGVHGGSATSERPVVTSSASSAPLPSAPITESAPMGTAIAPAAIASAPAVAPLDRARPATPAKTPLVARHAAPPLAGPSAVTAPFGAAPVAAAPDTTMPSPTGVKDAPAVDTAPAATHADALAASGPSEGALLLRARRALASDPATTFALTQEDARQYPHGELAMEREVLAIESLAALGRRGEARARLDTFEQRYPGSLPMARLERLLAP